jgi:hypothetical protein
LEFAINRLGQLPSWPEEDDSCGESSMAIFARTRTQRRPGNPPEPVDSRDYIVPFAIANLEAVPRDFARSDLPGFHCGVFLPRPDPGLFGRSSCPPRVLLLTCSTLVVLNHPSGGVPPAEIMLSDISSLETGNMLLRGWMDIGAGKTASRVEYNTRCYSPIHDFLRELRRAVFPRVKGGDIQWAHFGDEFDDVKFSRAGDSELDAEEIVGPSFLSLPRRHVRRVWMIHGEIWQPGDLVTLTDRRFIWITDRYKGVREPYGRVTRSVRISDIRSVCVRPFDGKATLSIRLRDCEWSIAVNRELEATARGFAEAVTRAINPSC